MEREFYGAKRSSPSASRWALKSVRRPWSCFAVLVTFKLGRISTWISTSKLVPDLDIAALGSVQLTVEFSFIFPREKSPLHRGLDAGPRMGSDPGCSRFPSDVLGRGGVIGRDPPHLRESYFISPHSCSARGSLHRTGFKLFRYLRNAVLLTFACIFFFMQSSARFLFRSCFMPCFFLYFEWISMFWEQFPFNLYFTGKCIYKFYTLGVWKVCKGIWALILT